MSSPGRLARVFGRGREILRGETRPRERSDEVFADEEEAGAEAQRRNLSEAGSGYWWIEAELPGGRWTLERRYDASLRDTWYGSGGGGSV